MAEYEVGSKVDIIFPQNNPNLMKIMPKTMVSTSTGGGGGEGTNDHRQLTNRNATNQHPIGAISGLQSALDAKQSSEIEDVDGYFSIDTVEGALSELGKAVFDPDYDMVIEINGDPDGNMTQSSSYHSSITQGSVANILDKLENDPSHIVKILVKWKIYYGTALHVRNEVLYPWVEYFSSGTWVEMLSTWSWWNAKLKVAIQPSGLVVVYPSFS